MLHEFSYDFSEKPDVQADDIGRLFLSHPEPIKNLVTWVFDEGTFVPQAKITGEGSFSIVSDHLGTPILSFDETGKKVWERELNSYGGIYKETGEANFIPWRYQNQYFDEQTGLCYNRFRYYSPETGVYLSQDPIGLEGNNPNLYAYVSDTNAWVDPFGLNCGVAKGGKGGNQAARKGLTNAQLVSKAGTKAFNAVKGKGPVVGTARHEYATNLLNRYQRIYGNRGLRTKVRSADGKATLDVLDTKNNIIYDWKFGNAARMSNSQKMKYQSYFPDNQIISLSYKYP